MVGISAVAAWPGAGLAADNPEAQSESVRGVGTFERDPIGIEMDRLFNLPFDLVEGYDPDAERGLFSTFVVFPKFETDLVYTDNIYRTSTNKTGDLLAIYRPVLDINSDWDVHSLSMNLQLDEGRYFSISEEDFTDYVASVSGNLEIDDFTFLTTTVAYDRSHGLRGEVDDPGADFGPTIQHNFSVTVSGARNIPDGLQFEPRFSRSQISFRDNGPIDNSDRWRTDYDAQVRVGWEIDPGTVVFVQPRAFYSRYRRKFDNFGQQRDLDQYDLTAGARLDPSPIYFLEFLAGLSRRSFADPNLQGGTDYVARGDFLWNPSSIWTITAGLSQTFSAASASDISGTSSRTFTSGVDWTPHDAVILGAQFTYETQEIVGATPKRIRDRFIFGVNAEWAINRNVYLGASASHETQVGTLSFDDLTENRFQLRLGAQL